ncbi:hypothetical protein ONZ45_g14128 [Pleurotus djamor]|nr:hypothetical protein ONZ45_g14128 [Pleurotus djamor]
MSFSASDVVIAVIGPPGAGKSTFIAYALRLNISDKLKIGHSLETETAEVQQVPTKIGKQTVVFLDSPGIGGKFTEHDVLAMISNWLAKNKVKLSGIIYMYPISSNRSTLECPNKLKTWSSLCGSVTAEKFVFATSMWGTANSREMGPGRVEQLKQNKWKAMIDQGAQVTRFDASFNSAWDVAAVISTVVKSEVLLLREEMADLHEKLKVSEAGQALLTKLKTCANEEEKIQGRFWVETREPNSTLQAQHEEARHKLELVFEEAEKLRITLGYRIQRFFHFGKARS